MAVYGKYREQWDPKKIKAKVSKNVTYERKYIKSGGVRYFDLKNTLFTHLRMGDTIDWQGAKRQSFTNNADQHLDSFAEVGYTKLPNTWTPSKMKIDKSRFGYAIDFQNRVSSSNQEAHNYIREGANSEWTPSQLFGGPNNGTHDQKGPRNIFFSFWIKTYTQNADNDGHTFAHWGLGGSGTFSQPFSIDPRVSFFVSSSGAVSIRFCEHFAGTDVINTPDYPTPGNKYVTADGSPAFLQTSSPAGKITVGNWHHVVFGMKFTNGWDTTECTNNTKVWVDGVKVTETTVSRFPSNFSLLSNEDETDWEWQFGSLINGLGSYDSGDHSVRRSSGFSGGLGEFLITTAECANDAAIEAQVKFLYEANREGVFALHSGIHSSTPRLELIDKDRDSLYPTSFSMANLTKFDLTSYFTKEVEAGWKEPSRYSLGSQSRYEEGYNSSEAWKEKASKYYKQSSTVMPHLGLDPGDTLLTNGNWYSDARSEFFDEDLDPVSGFVVKSTADHTPKTTDQLYREHAADNFVAPYVEDHIPPEYKDCAIIEIPIPSIAACTLSTDADGDSERRQLGSSFQTSNQSINTMAYYNFMTKRWEHTVPSYSTDGPGSSSKPGKFHWLNEGDIGFGPMSGLVLPHQQSDVEYVVDQYGRPITDFGFPFANKFASSNGQTINMAQYLDEPVSLVGWEIRQRVVPTVGYQHDGNTADGPDDYYAVSNTIDMTPNAGERKKLVFSPSGTISAGTDVTVTGIPFYDYPDNGVGYGHDFIDVYLNGDLQKGGSAVERAAGTADYNFGTDAGGNGKLQFRYNVGTASEITVIAHDMGGTIRNKKQITPSGTVTAGTGVPITGLAFSTFSNDHSLVDVFLNGELLRPGTPTEVNAGSKDYSLADSSGVMNATFRFNVSNTDLITVTACVLAVADTGGEVAGERNKQVINVASGVTAGSEFSVPNLAFNASFGGSNHKIDVFLNGELQKHGTTAQVNAGTADYRFAADASTTGKLIFRYNLTTSDNVIAIGRTIGSQTLDDPGGQGTGRNPFYYGAHGHATIMWNSDELGSPFTEEFYLDGDSGYWYHNNTVPILDSNRNAETKSIVTKGVTAFLLKETSLLDTSIRRANFHEEPRYVGLGSNLNNNWAWGAPNSGNTATQGTSVALSNANITLNYESTSFFDTTSTRSLVGYLQHIYHNDTNPTGSRSDVQWVRVAYDGTDIGTIPRYAQQMNLVGILDRENETYVENILRTNTSEYDFHVSGSVKIQPKMKGSFPITNFKIDKIYKVTEEGTAHANNKYYAESVYPSNEGGVDNPLINSEFIPSVPSLPEVRSIKYPAHPMPAVQTGATNTEKLNWRTNNVTSIIGSKNQVEDAETILRPTDKLILGIQDSVSTCFASQQNKPDLKNSTDGNSDFIRWGRNKLTIPVQQDAYIRLYVKRTRRGDTFNTVNTSYNFNQNVNRGIGDYFADDDHLLNVPLMFTGSMADDIVGPTYGSAPVLKQKIVATATNESPFPDDNTTVANVLRTFCHDMTGTNHTQNASHTKSNGIWEEKDFLIDWRVFSQRAYFDYQDGSEKTSIPIPPVRNQHPGYNVSYGGDFTTGALSTTLGTIVHPQNLLWAFTPADWDNLGDDATKGTCLILEQIDYNQEYQNYAAYQYQNSAGATKTRNFGYLLRNVFRGPASNGVGAWYQRLTIPHLKKSQYFEPTVDTLQVDFRIVQIGWWPTGTTTSQLDVAGDEGYWVDKRPQYTDGTNMTVGDVFYFQNDGTSVRLKTEAELKALTTIPANQKWFRQDNSGLGKKSELQFIWYQFYHGFRGAVDFQVGNVYYRVTLSESATSAAFSSGTGVGDTANNPKILNIDQHTVSSDTMSGGSYGQTNQAVLDLHARLTTEFGSTYDITKQDAPISNASTNNQTSWVKMVQKTVNASAGIKNATVSYTDADFFRTSNVGNPYQNFTNTNFYIDHKVGYEKPGHVLYIVGKEGQLELSNMGNRSARIDNSDSDTVTYTYEQVYATIADCLNATKVQENSLLYTAVANEGGNYLELRYPDDPILRKVFTRYKTDIDNASSFVLCGREFLGSGSSVNGPPSDKKIYFKYPNLGSNNDFAKLARIKFLTAHASSIGGVSVPGGNFYEYQTAFWYTNNPTTNTQGQQTIGSTVYPHIMALGSASSRPIGLMLTGDKQYMKGYLRRWMRSDSSNGGYSNAISATWADMYIAQWYPTDDSVSGKSLPADNDYMLEVDFTGVPTSKFEISITDETYSPVVSEKIDRKQVFRTTSGNAGPFGSLNPIKVLTSNRRIFDSLTPNIERFGEPELDLTTEGIPAGWILDTITEKFPSDIQLSSVTTKMNVHPTAAGYQTVYDMDPSSGVEPVVKTAMDMDTPDTNAGIPVEWTFSNTVDPSPKWPIVMTAGKFSVTNYIQKEFGGNSDYTKKTGKDIILGFGDNPQGVYTVRPSTYKYRAFNQHNSNTSSALVQELILDKPRGVRFGLYNIEPHTPKFVFSYQSYGQFRDLWEQGIDTKFDGFDSNETVYGSPVIVSAVSPTNPESPKRMEDTQRYNKTTNATITKPYIESNYEGIPQPVPLGDEQLRVDVAGSIRTRHITSPGNLSANIFRRS